MTEAEFRAVFPEEIVTTTCGLLKRHLSTTTWTPPKGTPVVFTTCNYRQLSSDSTVSAVFDPDVTRAPDSKRWRELFDRRYGQCCGQWRELLIPHLPAIRKRVVPWLPEGTSFDTFLACLALNFVRLSENESVVLGFGNLPILEHHDFAVALDAENSLLEIIIEG